jgi:hypothetical protein
VPIVHDCYYYAISNVEHVHVLRSQKARIGVELSALSTAKRITAFAGANKSASSQEGRMHTLDREA